MTETSDKHPNSPSPNEDPLVREVRLRRDRQERWLREGDMSIGRRLAQIGVLGWIIIVPTLGGLFLGHWIDKRLETGIFWTGPLLVVGLLIGGWSA